jgi:hypothetical protein
MNCPDCARLLYSGQVSCQCGWKKPRELMRAAPTTVYREDPRDSALATKRKLREEQNEVDAYVAMYLAKNRGANQKEACFAYMRENGLMHILPAHLRDDEAAAERQAIQQEAT